VTLQGLVEGFSDHGVPVFCVDVRGDLSGLAAVGEPRDWIEQRAEELSYHPDFRAYPVVFWDLFGEEGHSLTVTVDDLGPFFVSRLLSMEPSQGSLLDAIYRIADEEQCPLVRLSDLQALVNRINAYPTRSSMRYGLLKGSLDRIVKSLLLLETQGADHFIDRSAFQPSDLLRTSRDGRGCVSLLVADQHAASMQLYVTLQLFLLSELIRKLPALDGHNKPKLIFFFASAETLFGGASAALVRRVEHILNQSSARGVGIYFSAPSLADIPDEILFHLGNRMLHGSRAPTRGEQRSLTSNFRNNPQIDLRRALVELGTGEAIVSTLMRGAIRLWSNVL
jgi:DNA helicase HerA-like ATPase